MRFRPLYIPLFLFVFQTTQAQEFRSYNLYINDICYSPFSGLLYAASPGDWPGGNAVLTIDPATGAVTGRIACGSEPTVLVLSANGQYLYIGLRGAPLVRRYDLTTGTFSADISLEEYIAPPSDNHYPIYAGGIVPLPGQPAGILVAKIDVTTTPDHYGLIVYDNTVARPNQLPGGILGSDQVAITENGQTLWGLGHDYEPKAFTRYSVDGQGVTQAGNYPGLLTNGNKGFSYKNGRIYANTGQIFDVTGAGSPVLVKTFDVGSGFGFSDALTETAIDSTRFYVISQYNPANPYEFDGYHLRVFNTADNSPVREYTLPEDFTQPVHKMLSLGHGRLALLSRNFPGSPAKLVLLGEGDCPAEDLGLSLPGPVQYACNGDTLSLQGAPGYTEYFWSNGATGPTLALNATQSNLYYRVRGANGCLSAPSNTIAVVFEQRPAAPALSISYLGEIICPDETATITGYSPGGNAAFFAFSTGDTVPSPASYTVDAPGTYTVVALSQHGCVSPLSQIEVFAALPGAVPVPEIEIAGSAITCSDALPTLTAPAGAWGYQWSNGGNTRSIQPQWSGPYAVKVLFENGCASRWSDTIDVEIKYILPQLIVKKFGQELYVDNFFDTGDSLQWYLNGQPIPGAHEDSYIPQDFGIFSIGNFLDGCASPPSAPYAIGGGCQVSIDAQPNGTPAASYTLAANASPAAIYQYSWSGGSTAGQIETDQPGSYCVTATRTSDGCLALDCVTLESNTQIAAVITAGGQAAADVWVVLNDGAGGQLTALDTLSTDSLGMVVFQNIPGGAYALQGIPPLGHPLADSHFPTYYPDGHQWQEAEVFQHGGLYISGQAPGAFEFALLPTSMLASGSGIISGLVTQAPGFTVNPGASNPAGGGGPGPLANVEMLLFRDDDQVALYTYTDAEGQFSFTGLPYGTFFVYINLQGTPVIYAVVILSPSNSSVNGLVFTIEDDNVTVGTQESALPGLRLLWWPNPATNTLNFDHNEPLQWAVINPLGQVLRRGNSAAGRTRIDVAALPAGVYGLQVTGKSGEIGAAMFVKR